MTPLAAELIARIRDDGPIGVDTFMAAALGDARHGYYTTRDPFGTAGDFTTAPEISQVFGDVIGAWCAAVWLAMGRPEPFSLIELGPGRGTLAADLARALAVVPAARRACRLHLVETSPVLAARQRDTLASRCPDLPVQWHDTTGTLPDQPAIIVANEFFDALPVRQFVKRPDGWHERLVACADETLILTESEKPIILADAPHPAATGSIFELGEAAAAVAHDLTARVKRWGGAILVVDYGHVTRGCGDTLQAVRRHRPAAVLDEPGETDLTAHVDFAALRDCFDAGGLAVHGPVTQRRFLLENGAAERARLLSTRAPRERGPAILSGLQRLVDPLMMGHLFMVMAASRRDLDPLPGLSAEGSGR